MIYKTDVEYILKPAKAKKSTEQMDTETNGQLLAVGHYDGEKVEMAMYDDIKHNLKNEEK